LGGLGILRLDQCIDQARVGALVNLATATEGIPSLVPLFTALLQLAAAEGTATAHPRFLTSALALSRSPNVLATFVASPEAVRFYRGEHLMNGTKVQHLLTVEKQTITATELMASFKTGSPQQILLASSNNPPANAILRSFPSPLFKLTDSEFITGLLLRFGLPVLEGLKTIFRGRSTTKVDPCPICGKVITEGHERNCKEARRLISERHSRVRTALYFMLRSIPGVVVRSEHRTDIDPAKDAEEAADSDDETRSQLSSMSGRSSKSKQAAIQPDLSFCILSRSSSSPTSVATAAPGKAAPPDSSSHFIDLTIGDPLATYHAARAGRGLVPTFLEGVKNKKYRAWLVNNPGRFWPAGFSSLGQLGPQLSQLFDFISDHCRLEEIPFPRGFWMGRIGVILWRYLHKMQCTWATAATRRHQSAANATLPEPTPDDLIDPNIGE
jgi:predicted nucleic acid-binding Zn ribbon protein